MIHGIVLLLLHRTLSSLDLLFHNFYKYIQYLYVRSDHNRSILVGHNHLVALITHWSCFFFSLYTCFFFLHCFVCICVCQFIFPLINFCFLFVVCFLDVKIRYQYIAELSSTILHLPCLSLSLSLFSLSSSTVYFCYYSDYHWLLLGCCYCLFISVTILFLLAFVVCLVVHSEEKVAVEYKLCGLLLLLLLVYNCLFFARPPYCI